MTVKLQAGDYTALINSDKGANCISLRNSKYNAIILREPNKSGVLDNPYLYGMPILYPANRISGGCFEFEGKIYKFPINEPGTNCHLHGMLHEMEFEITEGDTCFVKCVFEKSYPDFPHSFRIEMTYKLSAGGLEQRTKITNLSEENMPNFLGFHTTFNVPFLEGASAEDVRLYAEIGNKIERDINYLPTGRILSYDDVDEKINSGEFMPLEKAISRHYRTKKGGQIDLTDIKQGIKLIYENDEKFGWRLFYNGSADNYICLEPMTCMANCQNSPFDRAYSGFDSIAPHSSKEYISKIYLSPAHFVGNPCDENAVFVTEGALKADIASALSGRTFIAVAGTGCIDSLKEPFEVMKRNGITKVYECLDMDKTVNENVSKAAIKLTDMISEFGFETKTTKWKWDKNNPDHNKGIDDMLLSKKKEELL